jgi:hypothetical protein
MGILSAYRSLSPEQKRLLKEKEVRIHRPVDEAIALLQPIAACDTLVGKSSVKLGCTVVLCIIGLVLSMILGANGVLPTSVAGALAALLAGLFIATIAMIFWSRSINVSDNLAGFAMPLLYVLRDDFQADEPLELRIDLRQPTDRSKKTGQGDPFKKGAYYKIVDTMFRDDWFEGEGLLTDGSRLRWNVVDVIRERKKSKRTARGKYKSKTKIKKKTTVQVELSMRKKTYAVAGRAEDRVKESEKATSIRRSEQVVSDSLKPPELTPLLNCMTGIYGAAKPAAQEGR